MLRWKPVGLRVTWTRTHNMVGLFIRIGFGRGEPPDRLTDDDDRVPLPNRGENQVGVTYCLVKYVKMVAIRAVFPKLKGFQK